MSEHFPSNEIACRCGCKKTPSAELISKLEEIRTAYGSPLYCTSGSRCDAYTAKLRAQGTPAALHSKHIDGLAADLTPTKNAISHFHAWILPRLEELGIWIEDPASTSQWCHIQIVPYATWKPGMSRIFKP